MDASDYLMTRRGSDVLMVSFGGLHEGFNFENLAERQGFDGLFFRDAKLDWYTAGVRGISDSFDEVCTFIRDISSKPYRRVFCIGQSSGGYAALRCAAEIEPHACLVFSPQTRPVGSTTPLREPADDVQRSLPNKNIEPLGHIYREKQPSFRVQIHLCIDEDDNPPTAYFWDDWLHVEELSEIDCVEIVPHRCSQHSVAYYLTHIEELDTIVESILQ